jgi:hypothetical protein
MPLLYSNLEAYVKVAGELGSFEHFPGAVDAKPLVDCRKTIGRISYLHNLIG